MPASSRWVLALFALPAMVIGTAGCNPSIHQVSGTVVSLRTNTDDATVCLSSVRNSGSTYGSVGKRECLSGIVVGYAPKRGDCITAQIQGESAQLTIRRANGC